MAYKQVTLKVTKLIKAEPKMVYEYLFQIDKLKDWLGDKWYLIEPLVFDVNKPGQKISFRLKPPMKWFKFGFWFTNEVKEIKENQWIRGSVDGMVRGEFTWSTETCKEGTILSHEIRVAGTTFFNHLFFCMGINGHHSRYRRKMRYLCEILEKQSRK
ncbi:MAG: hypothetical protein K6U80_12765 [Firmicutes bacterium]|nr:hypothetical protein [Bacillota bacterium]